MTTIEWTRSDDGTAGKTWNPVRGCSLVSEGCRNCYAMKQGHRFSGEGKPYHGLTKLGPNGPTWTGKVVCDESKLLEPLSWRKPCRVFVNSMSDLFHEDVPFEFVDRVWDVMWSTPRHTYQILTKRPERMVEYVRTRASRRRFGWTDKGRPAMHPGEYISLDDIRMRNMCGYVGEAEWACDHPAHGGKEDSCSERECPVASQANSREQLREIGVEGDYEFEDDGFADDCQWMQLEKRPKHAAAGNVWLGFSAEDQTRFDQRMRTFRQLRWILGPHFTLFASLEPLLSGINFTIPYWPEGDEENTGPWSALSTYDFSDGGGQLHTPYLNWVIVGGESGPGARPCDLAWVRSIVGQCHAAGVKCFVKQLGAHPEQGLENAPLRMMGLSLRDRKGGDMAEWPEWARVREFPENRSSGGDSE